MGKTFSKGDDVEWDWGDGTATGQIKEVHTSEVTKTIKGNDVTRNASEDCPAYTIEQSDGDIVLKSQSEVRSSS